MYRFSNRIPIKYFITQGSGESDFAVHAGSYHKALKGMGISDQNIMQYSSILAKESVESMRPEKIPRGAVMDVIQARMDGQKGDRITAGIVIGDLLKRTTLERQGSLVCELSGHESVEAMRKRLCDTLRDLFDEDNAEGVILGEPRCFIESSVVTKTYGTSMVAICFFEYQSELISHYNGYPNFMGSKCDFVPSRYAVIPCESKSASAILHASAFIEDYDIETDGKIKDKIHTMPVIDGHDRIGLVRDRVLEVFQRDKIPVLLDQDHSSSIGAFEALVKKHPEATILHLGSKVKLRSSYNGSPNDSLCTMKRAKDLTNNVVHVGIRSMANVEKNQVDFDKIFFDSDMGMDELWMDDVLEELTEKVYVSIDTSVFESGVMMATHPEPGGMKYNQVMRLLRKIAKKRGVVGFDVMELAPSFGSISSEHTSAKMIYQFLCFIEAFKG